VGSTLKDSKTEEEKSIKRQNIEVLDEGEDQELPEEVIPVDKGPTMIVEVLPLEKPKSIEGQSETK